MEINVSGIIIDSEIDLEKSDLRNEIEHRYNEMKLFHSKTSKSKLTTAVQGEKNRYSIFYRYFQAATFIIAELHPWNDKLESLSKNNRLLTFRLSDSKGIYIITLFEKGKIERRKIWCDTSFSLYSHFMRTYSELGTPLKSEGNKDGRVSVLGTIKDYFNIDLESFDEQTDFHRLTYKADKQKMKEWLEENG